MNIPDELLAAYVDGDLQGAERARIEQAILHDARLAQRVAQFRSSRARRRFDGALHEPVPQRLMQSARSASRPASAQVIDLARVRAERKRRNERRRLLQPQRLAIAAGILGGLLVGALAERLVAGGAMTEYRSGMLLAGGPLAQALTDQLTDQAVPAAGVRVGMSFKSRSGDYCRTFEMTGEQSLSGLACREQDRWRIVTLVGERARAGMVSSLAAGPAVAAGPPHVAALVLQSAQARMSGAALDAQAEARARSSDWH